MQKWLVQVPYVLDLFKNFNEDYPYVLDLLKNFNEDDNPHYDCPFIIVHGELT